MIEPKYPLTINGNGVGQASITADIVYSIEEEKQKPVSSYSSIDEKSYSLKLAVPSDYEIKKTSQKATSIIRTFYTNKMKESLEWLSMNHKTALESTPYIQPLLENLKIYKQDYFTDPYSSFVSALYDALVFNDSWMQLDREKFKQLLTIIIPLSNNRNLDYNTVDRAINKVEQLGLDTTPF